MTGCAQKRLKTAFSGRFMSQIGLEPKEIMHGQLLK
jgi:hypothetical protein